MAKVTGNMIIRDILKLDDSGGIARILGSAGMHCVGCPSASGETLEQACAVHGMDEEGLIEEINLFLSAHAS